MTELNCLGRDGGAMGEIGYQCLEILVCISIECEVMEGVTELCCVEGDEIVYVCVCVCVCV